MDRRVCVGAVVVSAVGGLGRAAAGQITPVGPFVGALREPLNFPMMRISADQPIFGGAAHLVSHDGNTFIHLILGSTFAGDPVTPRTGQFILGWTEGPGIFTFGTPVTRFGAYWNNNSGTGDALLEFFDSEEGLIGTAPATIPAPGNVLTWNGWEFDEPVSRIRVNGFGVLDGFLWTEDLEMTPVPGAGTGVVVLAAGAAWGVRRRR